jgi:hypothetical protein
MGLVGGGAACGSATLKHDGGGVGGAGGAQVGTGGSSTGDASAPDRADGAPADVSGDGGACALPTNCAVLHGCDPSLPSGSYAIFPDGPTDAAPPTVHCDMDTAGGGWTIIFLADAINLNAANIPYTVPNQSIRDAAQETLIAFRNLNLNMQASDWATFGLPATWRAKNPLSVSPDEDLTVSAAVNGGLPALALLRYGQANFSQLCSDDWSTVSTSPVYGRICLQGTAAAFYSGFAVSTADLCSLSTQNYAARLCSDTVRFSIAVR